MKIEMAKNSLFAILLRSPWWISALVALGLITIARLLLSPEYFIVGAFSALPFIVIAAIAGWRQLRSPSARRIESTLAAVRAMAWPEFARVIAEGLRRDGYEVRPLTGSGADFEAKKGWRTSLIGCKRWKAARLGVEPLRELQAQREAREAHECLYVILGEISEPARRFAVDHGIRLLYGEELVKLLPPAALAKGGAA